MTSIPTVKLNDGQLMPQLGYGVWQVPDAEAQPAIEEALRAGYRSIDTATIYENEAAVGRAVKASGLARSELFITTKLWNDAHGFDAARKAFDASLARLGMDKVELYLIHWPAPRKDLYVETWKALVEIKKSGRARSIGVSNFGATHLARIVGETGETPVVNQVELHPRFAQRALRQVHAKLGVVTEAWSPLGQGQLIQDPTVAAVARKHGKTPAQVILRWHLDQGIVAIPKSVTPARIRENLAVFGFSLDGEDRARLDELDREDGRIGPNPEKATF
jgi:2,5-diketo-D-gluconate reductase A